jgi:hypothetical protein
MQTWLKTPPNIAHHLTSDSLSLEVYLNNGFYYHLPLCHESVTAYRHAQHSLKHQKDFPLQQSLIERVYVIQKTAANGSLMS